MKPRIRGFLAATVLGVAALAVAQQAVRPGQYEITIEVPLPDGAAPMVVTQKDCLSTEQAGDFFKLMRADVAAADEDCKLSDPVYSGNKVAWDSDCEGGVNAKSEVTLTADGFDGVLRSVSDGEVLAFRITARWMGAVCTDDGDD